jgi:hypothetical protein
MGEEAEPSPTDPAPIAPIAYALPDLDRSRPKPYDVAVNVASLLQTMLGGFAIWEQIGHAVRLSHAGIHTPWNVFDFLGPPLYMAMSLCAFLGSLPPAQASRRFLYRIYVIGVLAQYGFGLYPVLGSHFAPGVWFFALVFSLLMLLINPTIIVLSLRALRRCLGASPAQPRGFEVLEINPSAEPSD